MIAIKTHLLLTRLFQFMIVVLCVFWPSSSLSSLLQPLSFSFLHYRWLRKTERIFNRICKDTRFQANAQFCNIVYLRPNMTWTVFIEHTGTGENECRNEEYYAIYIWVRKILRSVIALHVISFEFEHHHYKLVRIFIYRM